MVVLLVSARRLEAIQVEPAEPISTDRPSESAGPSVVPRHAFQIELGYKLARSGDYDASVDTQTLPDLLARFGAFDVLEARFSANGWSFRNTVSGLGDGFNDVSLGVKWAMAPEREGPMPALSLLAEVSLPVGDTGFTGEFINPKLVLLLQRSLGSETSVTSNVGTSLVRLAASDEREERTVVDLPYIALIAGKLGDRWGWFAELYGALALQGRSDRHELQGGITALVTTTCQLDVRVGAGLVANVPTWVFGAGVGIRVPR